MSTEQIAVVKFALERGEVARVRITGSSMLPTLRDGMIAEVQSLADFPQRGDILLYDTGAMLVAHRYLTRLSDERFLICADAFPKTIEHISRRHILGRVTRVWVDESSDAREIPAHRLVLSGYLMMSSRALRATISRSKEMADYLAQRRQTTLFSAITLALYHLMHERWAEGVALLNGFAPRAFVEICARHGLGGIMFRQLERAQAAGYSVHENLLAGVRSGRWMSAMRSDEVVARAAEVYAVLSAAGFDPIFLKGAARMLRRDVDADIHFSSDVDIILSAGQADDAVEALRARGYDHHVTEKERLLYRTWRQHRAPLWNRDAVVSIEIHTRLCIPGSVSEDYTYERLLPRSTMVETAIGPVRMLDRVGSAMHLAYHGRECKVTRDIYLLARSLREMNTDEYDDFMRQVYAERRDAVRVQSAVAFAHRFAGMPFAITGSQRKYVRWVSFREDLPLMFQKRAHLLEGWYARCLPPYQGVRHIVGHVYTWLYNAVATPLLLRWYAAYCRNDVVPFLAMIDGTEN